MQDNDNTQEGGVKLPSFFISNQSQFIERIPIQIHTSKNLLFPHFLSNA